ncbi:MAG: transposase [Cyanobacteriota bacterium]|nr:transposase [Cyanobacteriota bacterium]
MHAKREQAIHRCLEQGEAPARVAKELGMAASTLRGWLRLARLERELTALREERDAQHQRQEQLVAELQQAAAALAELRRLLDAVPPLAEPSVDPAAPRAAG